jgi:hypothetical protein
MRFVTTCRRSQTCLRTHALSFAHVCPASAVRGFETGTREDHLSREGDDPPGWIPDRKRVYGY